MFRAMMAVCIGGAAGSLLRYMAGLWMAKYTHSPFPLATFAVNIAGCFLIGLFYALSQRYLWFTPNLRLLLVTGFCGGLTTFSTFAFENVRLLQQGQTALFLFYSLGSFALSLVAFVAGMNITRLL